MPIRPEMKPLYPRDWRVISRRIRRRAGHRCEACGVPNYAVGGRLADGRFAPVLDDPHGFFLHRCSWAWCDAGGGRRVFLPVFRIVLTVAHLDHDPQHNGDGNLLALCQQCHNRHDAAARHANMRARARARAAIGDLFEQRQAP